MKFYAKLVIAVSMLIAVTNIAWADSFTVDGVRRGYFIPDGGTYSGKKLMVLDGEFGLLCKADTGFGININGKGTAAKTNVQVYQFGKTDAACYFRFIPLTGNDLGYYNIKASYCDMTSYSVMGWICRSPPQATPSAPFWQSSCRLLTAAVFFECS